MKAHVAREGHGARADVGPLRAPPVRVGGRRGVHGARMARGGTAAAAGARAGGAGAAGPAPRTAPAAAAAATASACQPLRSHYTGNASTYSLGSDDKTLCIRA